MTELTAARLRELPDALWKLHGKVCSKYASDICLDARAAILALLDKPAESEESDFKIAMSRRDEPVGATLEDMATKYGLDKPLPADTEIQEMADRLKSECGMNGDTDWHWQVADMLLRLSAGREARQREIHTWAAATFGADQASSIPQRAVRLLEEVIEAYQAAGGDLAMGHSLLDYVFARPAGELAQELGGVGVCLLCLAEAAHLSADDMETREIERIKSKPLEHFRERNETKNAAGFRALKSSAASEQGSETK